MVRGSFSRKVDQNLATPLTSFLADFVRPKLTSVIQMCSTGPCHRRNPSRSFTFRWSLRPEDTTCLHHLLPTHCKAWIIAAGGGPCLLLCDTTFDGTCVKGGRLVISHHGGALMTLARCTWMPFVTSNPISAISTRTCRFLAMRERPRPRSLHRGEHLHHVWY